FIERSLSAYHSRSSPQRRLFCSHPRKEVASLHYKIDCRAGQHLLPRCRLLRNHEGSRRCSLRRRVNRTCARCDLRRCRGRACWPGHGNRLSNRDLPNHKTCALKSGGHTTQRLADEAGHHERLWGGRLRDQQADLRSRNVNRVCRRILRNDLTVCSSGQLYFVARTELQPTLSNADGGSAIAFADDLGNRNALWAQTQRQPHLPAAANQGSGQRSLRQNSTFRNGCAVVIAVYLRVQTGRLSQAFRLAGSFIPQIWYFHFVHLYSQPHG